MAFFFSEFVGWFGSVFCAPIYIVLFCQCMEHFLVILISCRVRFPISFVLTQRLFLVRLARGRDEWESAALQNANTKCNGLLPIWGPQVTFQADSDGHCCITDKYIIRKTEDCSVYKPFENN